MTLGLIAVGCPAIIPRTMRAYFFAFRLEGGVSCIKCRYRYRFCFSLRSVDAVAPPNPVLVKGSGLEIDDGGLSGFTSSEGRGLESRERVLGCTEEFDCDCEETN